MCAHHVNVCVHVFNGYMHIVSVCVHVFNGYVHIVNVCVNIFKWRCHSEMCFAKWVLEEDGGKERNSWVLSA